MEDFSADTTEEFEIVEVVERRSDQFCRNNAHHLPPFIIKTSIDNPSEILKENGLAGLQDELFENYRTTKNYLITV
jgi:hypothetical protein